MTIFIFKMMAFCRLGFCRNLSLRIHLRVFVRVILSARYCLRAVVGALVSCALVVVYPVLQLDGVITRWTYMYYARNCRNSVVYTALMTC